MNVLMVRSVMRYSLRILNVLNVSGSLWDPCGILSLKSVHLRRKMQKLRNISQYALHAGISIGSAILTFLLCLKGRRFVDWFNKFYL